MAFKDALLQLSSYPEPTSAAAIEQAVVFAGALDARISALTFKIEIPTARNVLANTLLDIPGMVAAERQKSAANAQALISTFKGMATKRGVPHEQIVESCTTSQLAAIVTEHARMHDITMIPIGEQATLQQYVAESVIFGSGRPTITGTPACATSSWVARRRPSSPTRHRRCSCRIEVSRRLLRDGGEPGRQRQ